MNCTSAHVIGVICLALALAPASRAGSTVAEPTPSASLSPEVSSSPLMVPGETTVAPGTPEPGPGVTMPPPPPEERDHLSPPSEPSQPATSSLPDSTSASPSPKPSPASDQPFVASSFQVSALGIFQSDGNSFSPEIGWVPYLHLADRLALKFALDGAVIKGVGSDLVSVDYQALLSWGTSDFKLNIGGGGQTWISQGTSPVATGQFEIGLGNWSYGDHFKRIILGYSFYPIPSRPTHEVMIGGGIEF